jgi:hypothetical protein
MMFNRHRNWKLYLVGYFRFIQGFLPPLGCCDLAKNEFDSTQKETAEI